MDFKSLRGKDTSRLYLSSELDVTKLHRMYNDSNEENKIDFTTFREISNSLLVIQEKICAVLVTFLKRKYL